MSTSIYSNAERGRNKDAQTICYRPISDSKFQISRDCKGETINMPLEENHVITNLTLIEENVRMTDDNGDQILTRIFTATKTVDLIFPEEMLHLEKRGLERAINYYNDLLDRMVNITSITP